MSAARGEFSEIRTPRFAWLWRYSVCVRSVVVALCCAVVLLARAGNAQAVASAFRLVNLTVGAEASGFDPGYGSAHMYGGGVYSDLELPFGISAEAEARFLRFDGFRGQNESTYLLGPRYTPIKLGPFRPYVKALAGAGRITYPNPIGHGSYATVEAGAGVDFVVNRHWKIRGEYDYQVWPSAPGEFVLNESSALKPNGVSVGVGYRF